MPFVKARIRFSVTFCLFLSTSLQVPPTVVSEHCVPSVTAGTLLTFGVKKVNDGIELKVREFLWVTVTFTAFSPYHESSKCKLVSLLKHLM